MTTKDYYSTLGVTRSATQEQIRLAYRRLARRYHPDITQTKWAEERFKSLNEAYETLSDQAKRREYDQENYPGRNTGATKPSSWWSGGRPAHPQPREEQPGDDIEVILSLQLEEAAFGGVQEITLRMPDGVTVKTFHVKIPTGIRPGQKIKLRGQGEAGVTGGGPGDLYMVVEISPHPRFRLEGMDLHTTLQLTPWEAALGGEIELTGLTGKLAVTIPPGCSTGRWLTIPGAGFPDREGRTSGNLVAEVKVVVPSNLSLWERRLFKKLAEKSSFNPRG